MTETDTDTPDGSAPPLPPGLVKRSPLAWLAIFGPGAIIASVTIGTGELIFSSRGGALFGYDILFLFVFISLLKWALVLGTARHMVLTGVHPFQRMVSLPGPRGWLVLLIFMILAVCLPIWVFFHSTVLGNLTTWVTGTGGYLHGCTDYVWGATILTGVLILTATGGYSRLERIQIVIVAGLIISSGISLIIYKPDWLALLTGAVVPKPLAYPDWLATTHPEIAAQSVWREATLYVGVIAGSAFDYLAYTSWLRDKRWGHAGGTPASDEELQAIAADPQHVVRRWVRAPYIDCTISFILIIGFSAVFVAAGTIILGPNQKIPDEANLLNLQSEFVTKLHPWLLPLYVVGAFLTMLGTLYGTFEIATATFRELVYSTRSEPPKEENPKLKRYSIIWCATGAYLVIAWMFQHQYFGGESQKGLLLQILTPANLFTGVFACGLVCLLTPWMDRRFLPKPLHTPWWLLGLNIVSGVVFLFLGLMGYWKNESRNLAVGGILGLLVVSLVVAAMLERRQESKI
jgi:hypothetical protein